MGVISNFFKNGAGLCSILLNSSGNVVYQTGSDYRLKENSPNDEWDYKA